MNVLSFLLVWGLLAVASGLITGAIGSYVAKEKGRVADEGFLFGFFLSVLGIIIVALLPTKEKWTSSSTSRLEPWPHNDPLDARNSEAPNVSEEDVLNYLHGK